MSSSDFSDAEAGEGLIGTGRPTGHSFSMMNRLALLNLVLAGCAVFAVAASALSPQWVKDKVSDLAASGGLMASLQAPTDMQPHFEGGGSLVLRGEKLPFAKQIPQDCFGPCGGAGICPSFCGPVSLCCRSGDATDPLVCKGVELTSIYEVPFHECVPMLGTASAEAARPMVLPPAPAFQAPAPVPSAPAPAWDPTTAPAPAWQPTTTTPAPAPMPKAPKYEFYVYRAQSDVEYPMGNVNVGNLPGVMWYLANEVMAYSPCPRRYNIIRLRRMIIKTQATPELLAQGMNFGVRYSYDAGKCTGSNIRLLGSCNKTWDRYGYVPGCNNFKDHYPYPLIDTEYPTAIWYDLPLEGRCDDPTGARDCTWSYQEAGEIKLWELEALMPGRGYTCGGNSTSFWTHHYSQEKCERRVNMAYDLFARSYPDMPIDMPAPVCDFKQDEFWKGT